MRNLLIELNSTMMLTGLKPVTVKKLSGKSGFIDFFVQTVNQQLDGKRFSRLPG
jgi:hypothetical protein